MSVAGRAISVVCQLSALTCFALAWMVSPGFVSPALGLAMGGFIVAIVDYWLEWR